MSTHLNRLTLIFSACLTEINRAAVTLSNPPLKESQAFIDAGILGGVYNDKLNWIEIKMEIWI